MLFWFFRGGNGHREFNTLPEAIHLINGSGGIWALVSVASKATIYFSENGNVSEQGGSEEEKEHMNRKDRFSLEIPDQEYQAAL